MAKLHFRSYISNQTVLFPQRIDEDIAESDPVRVISSVIDMLDISSFHKLYKCMGRYPYHPRMMLKVIVYAYMNNIYSCRKIEKLLLRDIHFIWLAGYEKPDFITINRFRNRVKDEINNIFTQLVLVLAEKGYVTLDVEYVDGTKIESKANKYTFVWRKTVERNRSRPVEKIRYALDPFRSENFYYNKEEDYCVCPMGQHMTRIGSKRKTSASGYVSEKATFAAQNCKGCPLRCRCFKAAGDKRVIERNHHLEVYKKKASGLLTSEAGIRHRGRRCIEPEAVFGQMKYNMAYRRFRHIGRDKVYMDFAFFAIAFNLKKMVAKSA